MAEMMGKDPNWDRCPPELEDFPYDVQKAILCYSKFQDRLVPEIGYIGKDFTLFKIISEVELVDNESLFLEALLRLDAFFIEKSRKDMEAARKKASRGK